MELIIPKIDDFHVHLRYDERMNIATPLLSDGGVGRALVMPNTVPPINNFNDADKYKESLLNLNSEIEFLMTIKLSLDTEPDTIIEAAEMGILAAKQYPTGVTTNSKNGIDSIAQMYPIYEAMSDAKMVLSIHAEMPDTDIFQAEKLYLPEVQKISEDFPDLRIVIEHISTARGIETICQMSDNVAATITPHHMLFTFHDIIDSCIYPHRFCKPVPKNYADRRKIIETIKQGDKKFFFGSDSAPHFRENKEANQITPGVFTTPITAQLLAYIFEKNDMINRLYNFAGKFGADFYGVAHQKNMITLTNTEKTTIPKDYGNIVPLLPGKSINWKKVD
ncbi:MAG: dihydroorotase [Verrucomicrobiota bacterium]|nr:dihydroorotase [Verrucomicrobiota bacterium]